MYDGGFDLKQLTGNLRVDEALSLSIADVVDGRRTIKCVGDNRFGHFEMSGSCLEDGSDCVLVRIYAPKQTGKAATAGRAGAETRTQSARPTTDKTTEAREVRRQGASVRSRGKRRSAPRGRPPRDEGQVDARRGLDVGRPLAEVFEAVAAAQKNQRGCPC